MGEGRARAWIWFCSKTGDAMRVSDVADEEFNEERCPCGAELDGPVTYLPAPLIEEVEAWARGEANEIRGWLDRNESAISAAAAGAHEAAAEVFEDAANRLAAVLSGGEAK